MATRSELGTRGWHSDSMLCQNQSWLIIEDGDCHHCGGTGIEPFRKRARCRGCDGIGKHYTVFHDGSMFPGRDRRGVTRESFCEIHGIAARNIHGGRCCERSELRVI